MTRPRATLVSEADTPYYHRIGRCVRRAFWCGEDPLTGRSFTHRRQWMLDRLKLLTEVFAIELCAYALMNATITIWWCASTVPGRSRGPLATSSSARLPSSSKPTPPMPTTALSYDLNGDAADGATLFAILTIHPAINAGGFIVVRTVGAGALVI